MSYASMRHKDNADERSRGYFNGLADAFSKTAHDLREKYLPNVEITHDEKRQLLVIECIVWLWNSSEYPRPPQYSKAPRRFIPGGTSRKSNPIGNPGSHLIPNTCHIGPDE